MPNIKEYRALVVGGMETVKCGFTINGCEGSMPLNIAWHVVVNLEAVFSGDAWAEVFPKGFDLNKLTVAHLQKAGLISCDSCKKEMERAAAQAKVPKPAFLMLERTVNERANGRLQKDVAAEKDAAVEAKRRHEQALACLSRLPITSGNGHGKKHKLSAKDVVLRNGSHAPVTTA